MYRIGMVEDSEELLDDYIKRMRREELELLIAPEGNMEAVKNWIIKEHIKCLLIDHQLSFKYDFNGTEFAFYLKDKLPGFPYLIMTSYPEDSVDEKLVVKNAIYDRKILGAHEEEFTEFCEQLKQMTEVYDNTVQRYKERYEALLEKKNSESMTVGEEEELKKVFNILKAYGEVDEVPSAMLESGLSERVDKLLGELDRLLEK